MQITVTDEQILITAAAGAWSDAEFDTAVREHGLWDEFIELTDYTTVDGEDRWVLTRSKG